MKSKINLFFILLFAVLFTSCRDDDTPAVQNTIQLDGEVYTIVAAAIIWVPLGGEGGHAAIYLYNSASPVKALAIDIDYTDENNIDGNYAFPQTAEDLYLNALLTNYVESDGTTNYSTKLESGMVTIKNNGGNNYTVTMDLTMLDGKVFVGEYTGEFKVSSITTAKQGLLKNAESLTFSNL